MADVSSLVNTLTTMDGEAAVQLINKVLRARPELTPAIVGVACPDLTYAPAKAMTERRSKGTIKSFNQQQGFGFISCPELQAVFGKDVFLHGRQVGMFEIGSEVSFAVTLSEDNKPQAYDLQPANPMQMQMHLQQQQMMMIQGMGKGGSKGSWGGGWGGGGGAGGAWGGGCWGEAGCWGGDQGGWGNQSSWNGMGGWGDMGGCQRRKGGEQMDTEATTLGTFSGQIKSFNEKNGFGFIECVSLRQQGYDKDAFLHNSQRGGFQVGQEVTFTAYLNNNGQLRAKDLNPLSQDALSW